MKIIIKIETGDIITRPYGNNISIDTTENCFTIIFDPVAAVEFARDVKTLIPGGFDGSDDFTVLGEDIS